MKFAVIVLGACLIAAAQESSPLLNAQQSNELFSRAVQLMESTTVAMPELNRAGAPILENARQTMNQLRQTANSSELTYTFLINVRAYLALADAVPRPYPFPATAARQFAELRDALNRTEVHFRALIAQRESQLRSADRDNLARYTEANQKLPPPAPGKRRIVFLGDSITDAWRLNEYFPDQDFVNRGISGQITGQMLGRFDADVIHLRPDTVVLLGGTNDLARGVNILAIENNYSMIADLAEKHGIRMIFASVLPVSDYHKNLNPAWEHTAQRPPVLIRALNDWMKSISAQRGCVYLDYYSALVDNNGQLTADLSDDGLHPNSKGYRLMAPLAAAAIDTLPATSLQQKAKKRRLAAKDQ